tara:strand:+ start:502 stop:1521 length:1020 start_codon:yes stop_codon:yes gene_type:complete
MNKLNWGIIGLGNIANIFADAFKFSSYGNLKAIASKDRKKLNNFKKKFNIEDSFIFNNYDDLIKNPEVDIVYIALPNSLHLSIVLRCIDFNKRILVEKPATINLKEAEEIKKKLNNNLFFSEAMMYKFHPQIFKTIDLIKNGSIGNLISMETSFGHNILTSFNFFGFKKRKKINTDSRLFSKKLGGGAILDLGCYGVSMSTLIASQTSQFKNVKVFNIKNEICLTGVDIDSYVELKFDNDFKSTIRASFLKNIGRQTIIKGTKGEIILEDTWLGQSSNIILKNKNFNKIKIDSLKNIYSSEIDFSSKFILSNKTSLEYPLTDIDETIKNMKIIERWLNN